jgi:hypothetical protein
MFALTSLALLSVLLAGAAHAQACLDGALSVEDASSATEEYAFEEAGHAVDARGVVWEDVPGNAVHLVGGADACFTGGEAIGPYQGGSVYECSARHCPDRVCPDPCLAYHTTAALALAVEAPHTTIDDFAGSDYGDGVSLERESGDVTIRRAYLHDIRDDAVESDWGRHSVTIEDSLLDRVFVGLATRQRKKGATKNSLEEVWTLRGSLIRLEAFENTYKMREGHGGFFKADRKKKRQVTYRITGNVFFAGPLAVEGSAMFPIATQTEECENNVLFWSGTESDWEALLDDGDGYPDKLDNRGRLAELNTLFPDCYDVIVKPAAQSEADFVAEHWTPRADAWRASHEAGG